MLKEIPYRVTVRAALNSIAYYCEQAASGEMQLPNALAAIESALDVVRDEVKATNN
jgi:hypothetical protein